MNFSLVASDDQIICYRAAPSYLGCDMPRWENATVNGHNIRTKNNFFFLFLLFMKSVFKINIVLYDSMLITFTIYSDLVFSN